MNTGSRQLEVQFVFPLPYDGAIDQMTLMVDGKEIPGQAAEGRRGPADLRGHRPRRTATRPCWSGSARACSRRASFRSRRGQKRTVSLRYAQLCRKQEGLTDFLFPLSTAKYTSDAAGEVGHPRDDREPGGHQERLQPDACGRDQAAGRAPRHR